MGVSNFFSKLCAPCCGGMHHRLAIHRTVKLIPPQTGRSKDSIYDPVLADSEREAVADLLGFLENVPPPAASSLHDYILTWSSAPRPTSSLASPYAHYPHLYIQTTLICRGRQV
jgi:hypothetical protein